MSKQQASKAPAKASPAAAAPVQAQPEKETQALAVIPEEPKDVATIPEIDFAADAGAGLEQIGASDLQIPFLVILQKNSPQVDETSAGFIPGAKAGMIYNNVSGQLFDGKQGIIVVPAGYTKMFVEWIPRDDGGGFVGQHMPGSEAVKSCKLDEKGRKLITPDGNHMIETDYHFIVPDEENLAWSVIGMSSTNLKSSRIWNTQKSGAMITIGSKKIKAPIYAIKYRLTTSLRQKDKYSWFVWEIARVEVVDRKDLYDCAKAYYQAVASGSARVTAPPPPEETAETSEDAGAGTDGKKTVPF